MELPKPPQKGHSRAPSNETSRKLVASPRRRTLGPLDLGDVPSESIGSPLIQSPLTPTSVSHPLQTPPTITTTTSQNRPPTASTPSTPKAPLPPVSPQPKLPLREFPNLLHPHLFHPLPNHDLPLPFRQPTSPAGVPPTPLPLSLDQNLHASSLPIAQPTPDTPLHELLAQGYFRAAAITCSTTLPTVSPSNYQEIFKLWYIRLSCLCLIGAIQTACIEVKALEDLSAPIYRVETPPPRGAPPGARGIRKHLVPWELRLLATRLQALSFGDWRRALAFYYELAREARIELGRAINTVPRDEALVKSWKLRLSDLGIRVASALIEMGDLAAAGRHLNSLRKQGEANCEEEDAKVRYMLCLLYIHIGNFTAAREALPPPPPPSTSTEEDGNTESVAAAPPPPYPTYTDNVILSLLPTATGLWEDCITAWSNLPLPPPAAPPPSASASVDPLAGATAARAPQHPTGNIVERQNLAVSLVYTGRLAQARDILEDLIEEGNAFYALTFNLCTLWELVTDAEVTKAKKREVAEKVAMGGGRREAAGGWFKM